MHWDTNWAFTNGESRVHLVRTLDKVLFWLKKNEGPDTRSKIAHNVTRNTFFSRAICVLLSSRCRTMHECLISDVAFRLTGYWPIKLHYRSPFNKMFGIDCEGNTFSRHPLPLLAHPHPASPNSSLSQVLARLFDLFARKKKGNGCYAGYFLALSAFVLRT